MRKTFFDLLKQKMYEDSSVFLIVADMGMGLIDEFEYNFPDRFLNVGIAEQNMISVAAGLCNIGYRPFCYTISNFLVQRGYEQIRNDICLHNYPITLIGTSTGFDNGSLGSTHQCIDDIGCVKVLPNMNIYSPSTVQATINSFHDIIDQRSPSYIRIGKSSINLNEIAGIDAFICPDTKSNILIIVHSSALQICLDAQKLTNNFSILIINKLKPINTKLLYEAIQNYEYIYILEEHFASSGLFGIICEFVIKNDLRHNFIKSLSPIEEYSSVCGTDDYFSHLYEYSAAHIADIINSILKGN